jgi:hypothetical protein
LALSNGLTDARYSRMPDARPWRANLWPTCPRTRTCGTGNPAPENLACPVERYSCSHSRTSEPSLHSEHSATHVRQQSAAANPGSGIETVRRRRQKYDLANDQGRTLSSANTLWAQHAVAPGRCTCLARFAQPLRASYSAQSCLPVTVLGPVSQ